ncbi:MAG: hypothetical protein WDW36_009189 [Sanguina aurantia]
MPPTDLLKSFGLLRNPFTDRTAEKTDHDGMSLYIHSDLRGFKPSETTYVFFGRRGSGKTTIRLQLEGAYRTCNAALVASGRSKGHFWVDLCKPGHMTACLTTFQETLRATTDNWDAAFSDAWSTADMVDCILSYSATLLVSKAAGSSEESKAMLDILRKDPKSCRQFLLLAHLYARSDVATLMRVRNALMPNLPTAVQIALGVGVCAVAVGGAVAVRAPGVAGAVHGALDEAYERAADTLPLVRHHPRVIATVLCSATAGAALYYSRWQRRRLLDRAAALQRNVRVVKPQPPQLLASLLASSFSMQDSVDTVRLLTLGVSAHQKMELLSSLVQLLGYESLCVFGDCFDEVTLLDPVRFPGAIKAFTREVCRNDLLNFGRLHFFFPDSRLSLDLNTDKTLKEARFDRHFVRDLTWSRHQLEELAERRFRAAQQVRGGGEGPVGQRVRMSAVVVGGAKPAVTGAVTAPPPAVAGDRAGAAKPVPWQGNGSKAKAKQPKAQQQALREDLGALGSSNGGKPSATSPEVVTTSFADLFKKVRGEDFSSYLSKLSTPRELMIMMTGDLKGTPRCLPASRPTPRGGLTSQDMEIAVTKALEQSV